MVNNEINFYKIEHSENNLNIFRIIQENKKLLKPIALHDITLSKYATILGYYPMSQSKFNIFIKLDKNQRVGMLNRYILGVASKIGIHQCFLNQFNELRSSYKKYKKYNKKEKKFFNFTSSKDDDFWINLYKKNQSEMNNQYYMLLNMILEELNKRNNPKYLRKRKLQEIKNNLQN
jgi:hypothetical protein